MDLLTNCLSSEITMTKSEISWFKDYFNPIKGYKFIFCPFCMKTNNNAIVYVVN